MAQPTLCPPRSRYWTVSDLAHLLRRTPPTIRLWAKLGLLPSAVVINGRRMWPDHAVQKFLAAARKGGEHGH
jgi:DNA-binding transcriptional MerR regulator